MRCKVTYRSLALSLTSFRGILLTVMNGVVSARDRFVRHRLVSIHTERTVQFRLMLQFELKLQAKWCVALCAMLFAAGSPVLAQKAIFSGSQITLAVGFNGPRGVAVDAHGNLYVADTGNNAIKEILAVNGVLPVNPSRNSILTLGGGFKAPSGIAVDGTGNIYVADAGNNQVKELVANHGIVSGNPAIVILGSGFDEPSGVAVDSRGDVYVADSRHNQVKEIMAVNGQIPAANPAIRILGSGFEQPTGVAVDGAGNIYVTDTTNSVKVISAVGGVVPEGNPTIESLGGGFSQPANVAVDASGNAYIAEASGDHAIERFAVLQSTQAMNHLSIEPLGNGLSQASAIAVDTAGHIYVASAQSNAVFQIRSAVDFGTVRIETKTPPTLPVTFTFTSGGKLNEANPYQVLTLGSMGKDFALAAHQPETGACNGGINYKTGDSCTLNVSFSPSFAGRRKGAVQLNGSDGKPMVTAHLGGGGSGPQVAYLPPVATKLFSDLLEGIDTTISGIAVDTVGNIFFTSSEPESQGTPNQGGVYEAVAATGYTTVNTLAETYPGSPDTAGVQTPVGIDLDGAGDVFFADAGNNTVKEIVAVNGVIPANPTIKTLGSGFKEPTGLVVDSSGNVFVADTGNNAVKEIPAAGGYSTVIMLAPAYVGSTPTSAFNSPLGVALDSAGNLFVADSSNSFIKEIVATGGYTTVNTLAVDQFSTGQYGSPDSVAVDSSGNVYFAGGNTSAELYEILAVDGVIPATPTILPVYSPAFNVVLDADRDIYAFGLQTVIELSTSKPPSLTFAETQVGATSVDSPQTVTIENVGNAALTLSVPATGTNPSVASGFTLAGGTCPQLTPSSSSPGSLAAGDNCNYQVSFTPVDAGAISGSLVLSDNATPPTQTIPLSGAATAEPGPATHFSVVAPSAATAGANFQITVTALDQSNNVANVFAGMVHFTSTDSSAMLPADATLVGGVGVFEATLYKAGNQSITATSTSSASVTGTSATIAVTAPKFVVTTASDNSSGVASNCPSSNNCSLRDALTAAAATAGGGNITFDPTVFATAQTISANPSFGTMTIPENTTITGATSGSGASLTNLVTIDGGGLNAGGFVLFTVNPEVTGITVSNLNLNNGVNIGSSGGQGGAIDNQGSISVFYSNFNGNFGNNGGAIYSSGGLQIGYSTFTNNEAMGLGAVPEYGAAIYNLGTLEVNSSTFFNNVTSYEDSAIYSLGPVIVTGSTLISGFGTGANIISAGTGSMTVANTILSQGCSGKGCPANGIGGNVISPYGYQESTTTRQDVLGNNGGPTPTVLPNIAGAAVCAGLIGLETPGTQTDQRGFPRVTLYNGQPCVDAGAVQTHYAISFSQQPSATEYNNVAFPVSINITESGMPTEYMQVPLTLTTNLNGATLSGGASGIGFETPFTDATGTAKYSLTISDSVAEADMSLTALAGTTVATRSSEFSLSLSVPTQPPPVFQNFVVTTASDASPGVASNCPSANHCSLRDALAAAAAATNTGGNITFDATVFATPKTITLSGSNSYLLAYGTTTITGPTTGSGATLTNLVTIDAANQSTALVEVGTSLTVSGLNLTNGNGYYGGAIENATNNPLTVTNCTFTNNTATSGGGGAIESSGPLTVVDSTFTSNVANAASGGAIEAGNGTVNGSTFSNNSVVGLNPGSNFLSGGGAIWSDGHFTVGNSTFFKNSVSGEQSPYVGGGAIFAAAALTLGNDTFSGNSAFAGSPAPYNNGGAVMFYPNGAISGNSFAVTNSIFSGDIGGECLSAEANCPRNGESGNILDSTGTLAILAPLAFYGGTTQTMLPFPGSDAICAGLIAQILPGDTTDQRGFSRTTSYNSTPCVDSGAVQTHYSIGFTQQPGTSQVSGVSFPATVTVKESGNAISAASISLALSTTPGNAELFGGSAQTGSNGVASYSLTLTTPTALSGLQLQGFASTPLAFLSNAFSVAPTALSVTGVTPATGPITGGTTVTISGTGFTGATQVKFGGNAAASFTVNSANQITATTPAGSGGAANITVVTPAGTSPVSPADVFTYAPTATTLTPSVTPSSTFVYGQQPTVTVALTPASAPGIASSNFTATLDGTTALTVSGGAGNVFNIALPTLTVGAHSIAVAFNGVPSYQASNTTIALTVIGPNFIVTTTSDASAGVAAHCPSANNCSLRDALAAAAVAAVGGGDITFDPTVFATAQTISLSSVNGVLNVPQNTSITGATSGSGRTLTNLVTLNGGGSNSNFGILSVTVSGVTISNLTIANGSTANYQFQAAGGLFNTGSVTLNNVSFLGNSSSDLGGAVLNGAGGTMMLNNCSFSGNSTIPYGDGGAIANYGGTLTVINSTFAGNTATEGYGGAISNLDGPLTVANSTFSNNKGQYGGGAILAGGTITVTNSILSGDQSENYTAQGYEYVPDECNSSGSFTECFANGVNGNLIDPDGTLAKLAPLGNYGGPTETLLPQPGSAAICAGEAAGAIATDERGFNRPTTYNGASCYDAGAVQTHYTLSFSTQPVSVAQTAIMTPPPSVLLVESGAPFVASAQSVTLSLTTGPGVLGGGSALTVPTAGAIAGTGIATFTPLTVSQSGADDVLTASLVLNGSSSISVVSNPFNVTASSVTVTGIQPASGLTAGGTTVVITGTGFTGATQVKFGANAAATFTVNSATQITATSPAGAAGAVDVTVTGTQGVSPATPMDRFTYDLVAASTLTPTVTPSSTFSWNNQPSIRVALTPANAAGITTGDFTATLNGSTPLVVSGGAGNVFNIALPATPLTVGTYSISVQFSGVTGYPPSSITIPLTVTTPNLVVTSTAEITTLGNPANCPSASNCGLNDATAAAGLAGAANITFDPVVFATPQTINISTTQIDIPPNTTITGPTSGSGATLTNLLTISPEYTVVFPVFYVLPGATNTSISNLILIPGPEDEGGAIENTAGGTLAVNNLDVESFGGPFVAINNTGVMNISNSTFYDNGFSVQLSPGYGGAIQNYGTMNINNSTLSGNTILGQGSYGGAIFSSGALTLNNTAFSNNTALYSNVPSEVNPGEDYTLGGAVYSTGTLSVTNSVFSGDGPNEILSGNLSNECVGNGCPTNGVDGNIVDASGMLAPFSPIGNYGGPTLTMLPLPGSIAICAGVAAGSGATDQRGFPRPTTYGSTTCYDSGPVQTHYSLAFSTEPSNLAETTLMTPPPAVQLNEQGTALTTASVTIPLSLTGNGTLSGGSAATMAYTPATAIVAAVPGTGIATYPALSVNEPGAGDVLTAKLALTPSLSVSAVSTPFNVTAATLAVTGLNPSSGPSAGGTSVILTGVGFTGATQVRFGSASATFTVNSPTQITATAPLAALGVVDVVVVTPLGSTAITPYDQYTYLPYTPNVLAFTPIPAHTWSDSPFAVSATSVSTGAVTYAVVSGPATVAGNLVTLTGVGTVVLSASQAATSTYPATTAQTSFSALAAVPDLTFAAIPTHTFGDPPFAVLATSASSGDVTYAVVGGPATISGNVVTLTGTGAVTLYANQYQFGNYYAASTEVTFNVVPATTTTLKFAAIPTHTFGDAPFTVSATSASSGTVTYAVVSGPATITGNTVTLTGAGTVVLSASQAAAGSYPALTAQTSFTVNPASPTLAFAAIPNHTFGDAPFTVSAASASSGAVTYAVVSGPATISGNTVTITGAGKVTLSASQAATTNYTAATAQSSFTVNQATPTLAFAAIPTHTYGDAPFTVSATSASSGAVTYAVVSGPATISGNTVTLTGTGTVTLSANQAATANYTAATAQTSFNVKAPTTTLTFAPIPAQTFGEPPFTVSATSASSGAVSYAVVSGPATISGDTVTLTGAGTVTLSASQAAAGSYPAQTAQISFTVNPGTPTLAFASIPTHTYGDAPFTVSATSASTGAVTYSVVSGPATIAGNTVTLTGAGTVTLSASQAATTNYAAATSQTSFTVNPATPTLTFTAIPTHTFGDAPFTVSATSASTGAVTYTVVSGPATIVGNTVTLTGAGTVNLSASQAATTNYTAATAQTSFIANPESPVITWPGPAAITYGTPLSGTQLDATANVAGKFAYAPAAGTVLGAGTQSLKASFTPTDSTDYATASATDTLTVSPAPLTITPANASRAYGAGNPAFTYSASGFVNGDTIASLTGSPALTTTATASSSPGSYPITATEGTLADANYSFTFGTGTLAITQAASATVVAVSNPSIALGSSETITVTASSSTTGTPTGSVNFLDGTISLGTSSLNSAGKASITTTSLAVGTHSITAVYSGDTNFVGSTSAAVTVTVSLVTAPVASLTPATLSFTSTTGTTTAAQTATLSNTGNAALTISGITIAGSDPSDFAETNTCGSSLAVGASCSISVTFTPASATSLSATLSVADNAAGSPQTTALSGTGTPPVGDFDVSSPTAPQTVRAGAAASYSIVVATTPNGDVFSNAVTLTASGLPPGATVSFNPASVTPGTSSASSTMTVQTSPVQTSSSANTAAAKKPDSPWPVLAPSMAFLMGGFTLLFWRRKHASALRRLSKIYGILILAALGLGSLAVMGCGGGFALPSQPKTYTITVTGTAGSDTHSTTVTLTVN